MECTKVDRGMTLEIPGLCSNVRMYKSTPRTALDHPEHSSKPSTHLEVVQLLASDKTLLNGPDIDLYTPLHRAAECGHLAVCLALVDAAPPADAARQGAADALAPVPCALCI